MSLQRDFDWEASKLRGCGALIARDIDGRSQFCKFTLAFSNFFLGVSRVGKLLMMQNWQLWPTQIRKRWTYQSTVKYLSAWLSFQLPKATFESAQVLPLALSIQLCDILSGWCLCFGCLDPSKKPNAARRLEEKLWKMRSLHDWVTIFCVFLIFHSWKIDLQLSFNGWFKADISGFILPESPLTGTVYHRGEVGTLPFETARIYLRDFLRNRNMYVWYNP